MVRVILRSCICPQNIRLYRRNNINKNICDIVIINENQYIQAKCPNCKHTGWVNDGCINDVTKTNVEACKCCECNHKFFIDDFIAKTFNNNIELVETELLRPKKDFPALTDYKTKTSIQQ